MTSIGREFEFLDLYQGVARGARLGLSCWHDTYS
jgi:hypothetical protein